MLESDGKKYIRHKEQLFINYTQTKTALGPCKQNLKPRYLYLCDKTLELSIIAGFIEPLGVFEQNSGTIVTSSLNCVDDRSQNQISFLITTSNEATILAATNVAVFTAFTSIQGNFEASIVSPYKTEPAPIDRKKQADSFGFQTTKCCKKPENLTCFEKIVRRIHRV